MSEWPEVFPEGVSPDEAVEARGAFFRLVRNCPPQPGDFLSSYEEFPGRNFGDNYWMAHGLSVFQEAEDAEKIKRRYRPLRDRRIASGEIADGIGKMKPTPSKVAPSHVTVWIRRGKEIHTFFNCLDVGES